MQVLAQNTYIILINKQSKCLKKGVFDWLTGDSGYNTLTTLVLFTSALLKLHPKSLASVGIQAVNFHSESTHSETPGMSTYVWQKICLNRTFFFLQIHSQIVEFETHLSCTFLNCRGKPEHPDENLHNSVEMAVIQTKGLLIDDWLNKC